MADIKDATNQHFRLLDLPTELQLRIFEFTVVQEEPVRVNFPCAWSFSRRGLGLCSADEEGSDDMVESAYHATRRAWDAGGKTLCRQPALSKPCKAVRHDVLKLFYGKNAFEMTYCDAYKCEAIVRWARSIGAENRRLLKNVVATDTEDDLGPRVVHEFAASLAELDAAIVKVDGGKGSNYRVIFR
ncbi:hypothetical protein KC340_g9838 [Hortaea werneckii]|nr:hypothetical protein KC342_g6966 [Hortaea werneckii]KAI7098179.1 hypothetical protein KC339_g9140 [Hortaea werneckii]KAI7233470.1 hypothetical protein KC365_g6361 [Hortaea werneckii]KAI7312527.1 hypothetical protein KC340_g9838 [Hortaea werneckii]KAI7395537.1 hypothetical protein KC328_g5677 [Hortaea werneckii]